LRVRRRRERGREKSGGKLREEDAEDRETV